MKTRPDLNQLAREIFEANKAKGFHEVAQSNETYLMLVIADLSKAVEAEMNGKRCLLNSNRRMQFYNWYAWFEWHVKDALEDKLADAVIRLLDLAGLRGIEVKELNLRPRSEIEVGFNESDYTFTELVFAITGCLFEYGYPISNSGLIDMIDDALTIITGYCEISDIDLWQHVEMKMRYNATRP